MRYEFLLILSYHGLKQIFQKFRNGEGFSMDIAFANADL